MNYPTGCPVAPGWKWNKHFTRLVPVLTSGVPILPFTREKATSPLSEYAKLRREAPVSKLTLHDGSNVWLPHDTSLSLKSPRDAAEDGNDKLIHYVGQLVDRRIREGHIRGAQ